MSLFWVELQLLPTCQKNLRKSRKISHKVKEESKAYINFWKLKIPEVLHNETDYEWKDLIDS